MKSKAHIYMANLIMDEIKKNGRVKIGETEYAVPTKVFEVIDKYPNFVRAGSVGPDFFPDLLVGQMVIHSKESGEFLKLMWDELTTMKEGTDYDQAFAFYLGFTLHYACDMFSHYYINKYAGGFFPSFSIFTDNGVSYSQKKEAAYIILKHITLESYMDNKIKDLETSMNIPKKYLMRCFGTIESWQRINSIVYNNPNIEPSGFNLLHGMVKEYSDALKSSKNIVSKKSQELQERIDVWMTEWQNFVVQSVAGKGREYDFSRIEKIIRKVDISGDGIDLVQAFIYLHQISHGPLPIIHKILTGKYLDPMYWIGQGVQLGVYQTTLKIIYESIGRKDAVPKSKEKCKEEFRNIILDAITDSEKLINSSLFEGYNTDHFDKEWGNFGEAKDCQSQTFNVFRHCLNMGKLCLVGNNNLIKIGEKYKPKQIPLGFKDGSNIFKDGVLTHKVSKIKVKIKVADEYRAGTDYDTHLKVIHKNGYTKYYIDSKGNDLERGHEYTYQIIFDYSIALNDFKEFELGCDYTLHSAEFIIDGIVITDIDSDVVLACAGHSVIQRGKPLTIRFNGNSSTSTVPTISKLDVLINVPDEDGAWTRADVEFTAETNKIVNVGPFQCRIAACMKILNNPGLDFKRGSSSTYEIYLSEPVKIEDLRKFILSVKYNSFIISKIIVKDGLKNITLAERGREVISSENSLIIPLDPNELLEKYK